MLIIGLTGGIGSGKSTVSRFFADLGCPIIDTDLIARQCVEPETTILKLIIEHFGQNITDEQGALNRKKLAEIIFADPKQRIWLEDLLHPLIWQQVDEQIKLLNTPYCIVVVPLLIESECFARFDRILVIDTPEQLQILRAQRRSDLPKTQIEAIIAQQAHREQRLAHAHDVIENSGNIEELISNVRKHHQKYVSLSTKRTAI